MSEDIRNRLDIRHEDVTALNFVNAAAPYVFRRHFRQGLRSHIIEILDPSDVTIEQSGTLIDGIRWFPKAVPRKMFRIFRARFKTLEEALTEIGRVKIVERFLAPDFMARSSECIVDYHSPEGFDLMLCGFQEYVLGETLDPWTLLGAENLLPVIYDTIRVKARGGCLSKEAWMATACQKTARFIDRIKQMITQAGHIPDLSGEGNLIFTVDAGLRLVDINNISRVVYDSSIGLDEKGYPVCDKSIEALALIEEKVLGRRLDRDDPVYHRFLDPQRLKTVQEKESLFRKRRAEGNFAGNAFQ
jgi:hypothetical protein